MNIQPLKYQSIKIYPVSSISKYIQPLQYQPIKIYPVSGRESLQYQIYPASAITINQKSKYIQCLRYQNISNLCNINIFPVSVISKYIQPLQYQSIKTYPVSGRDSLQYQIYPTYTKYIQHLQISQSKGLYIARLSKKLKYIPGAVILLTLKMLCKDKQR